MAAEYVGAKLRITTEEGSYEGTVHSIDPVRRRLTLSQVTSCTKGKPPNRLHGFQNFFGHELNNLEILEKSDSSEDGNKSEEKQNTNHKSSNVPNAHPISLPRGTSHVPTMAQKQSPLHPAAATSQSTTNQPTIKQSAQISMFRNAIKDAGLLPKRSTQTRGMVTKDASDDGTVLLKRPPIIAEQYLMNDHFSDDDEELSPQSPPKTIVLDECNDRFENAIKYINSQRVVGLSCEGVNLGRHGTVCWVVIGCRHFTYLFDIVTLGGSCLDKGISEILENGNILKVTHDCRQLSDALFHLYSIKLVNVFDTQVSDIIIYKNEKGGNLPRAVNGLVGCLYEYLNLSPEQCHFQKVRITNMHKDEAIWSRRPLSQQLIDSAAKRVMYLRELRLAQMERMMAEFIYGVDIYLTAVRDAKNYRVTDKRNSSKSRQVPQQFQELYKFRNRQRTRKFDEDFANDAQEDTNHDQPAHTDVWREGENFTNTYRTKHGRLQEQALQPLPGWYAPEPHGRGRGTGTDADTRAVGYVRDPRYSEESEESAEDSDNPFHFSSINIEEPLSDNVKSVNVSQNLPPPSEQLAGAGNKAYESFDLRERDALSVESNSGSVMLRQSGPLPSVLSQTAGSNSRSASDVYSGQRDTKDFSKITGSNSAIFKEEDFPPLSDSYSDTSVSSTPPRSRTAADESRGAANNVRDDPRGSSLNAYSQSHNYPYPGNSYPSTPPRSASHNVQENPRRSQSPLAANSFGFGAGRGRASLFQHMSNIPHARLPQSDNAEPPWRSQPATVVGGLRDRHVFPSDHELLAASEVTFVQNPSSILGGTQVRIRQA